MPLVCIQCAMEAVILGVEYVPEDESAEAHVKRVHPDPVKTEIRRRELEQLIAEKLREGDV